MYKLGEIKIQLELLCYSDRNLAWIGLSKKKKKKKKGELYWLTQQIMEKTSLVAWEAVGFEPQVSCSVSELYSGNYGGTP